MTYAESANGHTIVLMAAHAGPARPELACFRKARSRGGGGGGATTARHRHERPRPDGRLQAVYEIVPADGGGRCAKRTYGAATADGGGGGATGVGHAPNRKGRPRGSKNKRAAASDAFDDRCEKKSFAYECTTSARCEACGRTYDGDPVAHCREHHEAACPVCGGECPAPTMAAHVRSHGARPPTMTVACLECYECAEKYGDAEAMAAHVRDRHVGGDGGGCGGGDRTDRAGPRTCAPCGGVEFDSQRAFVEHAVAAHCARKTFRHPAVYRCRVCHAGFKTQINVLRHACNRIKTPHCARCDKTFPSKMRYSFHLQFHERPGSAPMHLHCDVCLAEFEDEYQLYDHIRFRHELHDKAVCEVCGRTFKSSMGLNIHRRYHNGSRNFACASCDKSFLNKSTLKEHEISHMDVKPFQCHICGQYLSRASRLRSHVKSHRAAESTAQACYCCARCGFAAPDPGQLAEHLSKRHDGDPAADAGEEAGRTPAGPDGGRTANVLELRSVVKCEFCDSTYMDAASLNSHRDAAHASRDDSDAFICVVCSSTFSTYSRLTTHKLTHGINMESSLADGGPSAVALHKDRFDVPQYFSCQYCDKRCLHYTYFCLHRRLKHPPLGEQAHTCDRCFLDFKTSWRLSYHKKTVHGQPVAGRTSERYACTVCPRKFYKIGALNLHKTRTHIDVNGDVCKYLCHVCGKFFSSECSLRNHSKAHDDGAAGPARDDRRKRRRAYRKPAAASVEPAAAKNSCPYCDRTVDDNAAFVEHVNSHVLREPAVQASDGRPTAGAVSTSGPPVMCELCDLSLADAALLGQHLAGHAAADDVFLCTECWTPFLSSVTYDAHRSTCAAPRGPDVRFVGSPGRGPSDGSHGGSLRPALVIDCSELFNGKTATAAAGSDDAMSTAEQALIDELLGIMSTPSPATAEHGGQQQDLQDSLRSG